jgi:nucleotide-binding universal stress UspA family protein
MLFDNILVTLDGSPSSKIATRYGFWLASELNAQLSAVHIIDPRVVDLLIAPEFVEELGLSKTIDVSDKVFIALRKIGKLILEVFAEEALGRGLKTHTYLEEGYITEEILRLSLEYDLVIMGHHGYVQSKMPVPVSIGSVAERVAVGSKKPVLIVQYPVEAVGEILVAYDGSEAARGALLMAEQLAKYTRKTLKAMLVIPDESHLTEAKIIIEQAKSYLRESWNNDVFIIKTGHIAKTILDYANKTKCLVVVGAYGYRDPEDNVLGTTTTHILRTSTDNLLIYR